MFDASAKRKRGSYDVCISNRPNGCTEQAVTASLQFFNRAVCLGELKVETQARGSEATNVASGRPLAAQACLTTALCSAVHRS